MTGLALLFRFMTRIPIGFNPEFDSEKLGKSMKFFPVIGIIIGIINYLFYILFSNLLMGPNIIVVVLLVLVELIYNVVLISAVQQCDSVIHIYTFLFNIPFHYGLSQEIEYSSLCYTVGPCCLSILNVIVCIY